MWFLSLDTYSKQEEEKMEHSVEQFTYFIRQERERNYTVMDNTFLKDKRLSWKAKGLFAYILSLPSNWKIYQIFAYLDI